MKMEINCLVIYSFCSCGPVGVSLEEGHEDGQGLEHLSCEEKLRAGPVQPGEVSKETLKMPFSN